MRVTKRWAKFTAWVVVCCGRRRQGGGVGMARDCWGSLLAGAVCSTAAADAQVGGCVVHNALKRDDDGVKEAFEGVDVIGLQVLVGVEERTTHHNKEQELEQHRQEASSGWRFARSDGAARSGERLRVRAGLSEDVVLHAGLIQPVFTWFYWSTSCPSDWTPAGRTEQENNKIKLLG